MLHKLFYIYVFAIICSALAAGSQPAHAEQLWYTIQAGSSVQQKDAERVYNRLAQMLPPALTAYLRIEHVSSYFTIRLGKAASQAELKSQLEATKKIIKDSIIMQAYVRDSRTIIKITNSQIPEPPTPPTTPPPTKKQASKARNQLFYTVQAASYNNENDAKNFYDKLADNLPDTLRDNLRIEKISSVYAVRIGKATDKKQLDKLYTEIKKQTDASIIKAYIRQKRTIVDYTSANATPAPLLPPTKKGAKPAAAKKKTIAASGKPVPQNTAKPQEAPISSKKFLPANLPQAEAPVKNSKIKPLIIPKESAKDSIKIGSPEYKKLLITKYLGDQSKTTANHAERIARSDKFPASTNCQTSGCHTDLLAEEFFHYPVKTHKCSACHQQKDSSHSSTRSGLQLTLEGSELCYQCHKKFGNKENTHSPVAEGECLACHNPHSSANRFLLPVGMEGQDILCLECHDDQLIKKKKLHGPVGLGTCTYCHSPHESDYDSLLKDSSQNLCISCHDSIAKGIQDSPYVHSVVTSQGCTSCHNPHGSDYGNLLNLEGERFCFTCHESIEDKYSKSRSKHAALYLKDQCGTCHFPHFSKNRSLLNNNEYDLCLSCHSENNTIRSKSPKNIASEMKKNYLHKPVADGDCSLCHDPHGSKNAKLLVAAYPGSFYAPYSPKSYALCFTCHDEELLTMSQTEDFTNFRNGSQNLHYVHVAIERKGRTCQSCHQPHASDGPKLINQLGSVFGAWTMSIKFSTTTAGGTCTPGCHRVMEYDREHAVDNSVSEDSYGDYYIDYESIR